MFVNNVSMCIYMTKQLPEFPLSSRLWSWYGLLGLFWPHLSPVKPLVSSPLRLVQWLRGRRGIVLAQLCFQTVAPSPALMLTPADPYHPIALFRVIFVIPHAMKILTPGGNHSQLCPFQNWSVFKTCNFQYPGMVSPRDLSFLSQHCLGPAPGLFSNIAAPHYLSPPDLAAPH